MSPTTHTLILNLSALHASHGAHLIQAIKMCGCAAAVPLLLLGWGWGLGWFRHSSNADLQ